MGGLILQPKQGGISGPKISIGNRYRTVEFCCGLFSGVEFEVVAIDHDKDILHIRSAQLLPLDPQIFLSSFETALDNGAIRPILAFNRKDHNQTLPTGYCLHEWATYNSGWSEYEYCSKCGVRKDGSQ